MVKRKQYEQITKRFREQGIQDGLFCLYGEDGIYLMVEFGRKIKTRHFQNASDISKSSGVKDFRMCFVEIYPSRGKGLRELKSKFERASR